MERLQALSLEGTGVTDEGLKHVGGRAPFPGPSSLSRTQVTDAGLGGDGRP